MAKHEHAPCKCGGYHHPHRKYSPYCVHNSLSVVLELIRAGYTDREVLLTAAAESSYGHPGRPVLPNTPIPF